MWKHKLCLGLLSDLGISPEQQVVLFKQAGFDGFFADWSQSGSLDSVAEVGKRENITLQSIHAPFKKCADLWAEDQEKADAFMTRLFDCLADCKRLGAPIMIVHPFIGFTQQTHIPTEIGLERFETLVKAAEECDVKIAFENVEGEEYLAALMERFSDRECVGFCWDSGHEMCYNHSKDMLSLYGDRLIALHLNDNLGISRFDGNIFWTDDLHLLPFDGIADWDNIAARLDRHHFSDFMTFELSVTSSPDRHEKDIYRRLSPEEYIAEVYKRACRVAAKRKI